jgi:hypothetical protein
MSALNMVSGFFVAYAGAEIHNYCGTRFATPRLASVLSISMRLVSLVGLKYFSEKLISQAPLVGYAIGLSSFYIASSVTTQMGFPIELQQLCVQVFTGLLVLGAFKEILRTIVIPAVEASIKNAKAAEEV